MRPSSTNARAIVDLRMLAADKGYEIERSTIRDCWRLIGADGAPAMSTSGTKAFTLKEARQFLSRLPDVG